MRGRAWRGGHHMGKGDQGVPAVPRDVVTSYHDGVLGRMRSRAVGEKRPGIPEVVLLQGMGVADYLLPGLAASPKYVQYEDDPAPWQPGADAPRLNATNLWRGTLAQDVGGVILAGHSSGTQVAARGAVGHPGVVGVVLASPTVDPVARGPVRLFVRWQLDGRREPAGLTESHRSGSGRGCAGCFTPLGCIWTTHSRTRYRGSRCRYWSSGGGTT